MLTGEFRNMVDEKGRILIPSRLRNALDGNTLFVTRGVERCLWLMLPDDWKTISEKIMSGSGAMFDARTRLLQRRIIAPAQECEIDRSGRINIPPTLREKAGIEVKNEAIILGINNFLELWSVDEYDAYMEESEKAFEEASQALSVSLSAAPDNSQRQ
ncbi:MAG: division/cell wall cluster transcriptional repressor MraZ [Spirochaetia bacterium]|nr:division/cell wall cluster transcriptional repressor MraZ [Spirochaetia bacterium]